MAIRIREYEKAFKSNDAIFSFQSGGGENIGVSKAFYDTQGSERQVLVKDIATLLKAGYINASDNDLNAITNNKKVGLVYH